MERHYSGSSMSPAVSRDLPRVALAWLQAKSAELKKVVRIRHLLTEIAIEMCCLGTVWLAKQPQFAYFLKDDYSY